MLRESLTAAPVCCSGWFGPADTRYRNARSRAHFQ